MNKKVFISLLSVGIILVIAAFVLILRSLLLTGAEDAVTAITEYKKSAMLYDTSGMEKYSSEYNTAILKEQYPEKEYVFDYLKELYETKDSLYDEDKLEFSYSSLVYINEDDADFDSTLEDYKTSGEFDNPKRFARMTITAFSDGRKVFTSPAYACEVNGRWFFWKTEY